MSLAGCKVMMSGQLTSQPQELCLSQEGGREGTRMELSHCPSLQILHFPCSSSGSDSGSWEGRAVATGLVVPGWWQRTVQGEWPAGAGYSEGVLRKG